MFWLDVACSYFQLLILVRTSREAWYHEYSTLTLDDDLTYVDVRLINYMTFGEDDLIAGRQLWVTLWPRQVLMDMYLCSGALN